MNKHICDILYLSSDFSGDNYTFGMSYALFKVTDWIIPMRVNEVSEEVGLDISQHGESMSKSKTPEEISEMMNKAS